MAQKDKGKDQPQPSRINEGATKNNSKTVSEGPKTTPPPQTPPPPAKK